MEGKYLHPNFVYSVCTVGYGPRFFLLLFIAKHKLKRKGHRLNKKNESVANNKDLEDKAGEIFVAP